MWEHISDLKNSEEGKDVYIIGSGKSLDYINLSFFDGKTTIGISDVHKQIECKYNVTKEGQHLKRIINESDSTFIVSHYCNGRLGFTSNKVDIDETHYYFEHKSNDHELHLEELDSDRIIVSWATVNTALHIAYYLGAKNIILAGCDCGTIDGESNYNNYRDKDSPAPPINKKWYDNWLKNISKDILILANELRKRGIGVISLNPFINFQLEGHIYK